MRSGTVRRRFALAVVAAGLGLGTPALAAEPERVTGEAGSWVILQDAEKAPLAAWYWLGPAAILAFPPEVGFLALPGVNEVLVVDHGLLPSRRIETALMLMLAFTYSGVPAYAPMAEAAEVTVQPASFGIMIGAPPRPQEPYSVAWRWTGEEMRGLGDVAVLARSYELSRPLIPRLQPVRESRVYLPAYDVDIDSETWANTAAVLSGAGMASSADLAFEGRIAEDSSPATTACLVALRAEPGYPEFSRRIGELERRTVDLLPDGMTDVIVNGAKEYIDLEAATKFGDRFMTCLTEPVR